MRTSVRHGFTLSPALCNALVECQVKRRAQQAQSRKKGKTSKRAGSRGRKGAKESRIGGRNLNLKRQTDGEIGEAPNRGMSGDSAGEDSDRHDNNSDSNDGGTIS